MLWKKWKKMMRDRMQKVTRKKVDEKRLFMFGLCQV
jgi:hypothetical protein